MKTYRMTATDSYNGKLFDEMEWFLEEDDDFEFWGRIGDLALEWCCPDRVRIYDDQTEIPLTDWSPQQLGEKIWSARCKLTMAINCLDKALFDNYAELAREITEKIDEAVTAYEKAKETK